jgi:hypothetical protein
LPLLAGLQAGRLGFQFGPPGLLLGRKVAVGASGFMQATHLSAAFFLPGQNVAHAAHRVDSIMGLGRYRAGLRWVGDPSKGLDASRRSFGCPRRLLPFV